MADEGYIPGQPYYIKPLHIVAGRVQTFSGGGGGGYIGNGDGWGLQEGPHRGTGGPSKIHDIALPNVMAEFMNEQIYSQLLIDNEYNARFKTLFTDTERELEERKQAAKGTQTLAPAESTAVDQKVTFDLIAFKKSQYISIAPSIYGLYGQSPFFLMEVLPRQKMREFLNSGSADTQALMKLYAMFDSVYKSALELKALSLSMDVLTGKLADLAGKRNQAAAQDQRLGIIAQERDIHVQQLPEFLQTELVAAAGSVAGLTPTQALTHYKATLDRMAAAKTAEIGPIQAPPPFRRNGLTITFPAANPKITAPLSKPELEALNELVYLQTNTPVGVKWLSYHDALLKAESARYLTTTSNAFGGLAVRSNEAEQIAEAKRLADEQARIAAEAEAKRVADEQARIAAETEAYKSAVSFLADVNKDILAKYGENMSKVALGLQDNISGKKVRSYADAMKTFEKVRINPNIKLNAQDTQAVVDALNALDKATFSDNVSRLAKAFGVVGKVVQADSILTKTIVGFETGDWKPLGLELESMVAGAVVGAVVGGALAAIFAILGTPVIIAVPVVAIVMAFVASFFDAEKVEEINMYFIN